VWVSCVDLAMSAPRPLYVRSLLNLRIAATTISGGGPFPFNPQRDTLF